MTGSQPDPHASQNDLDPTGVRALLANLPDPGPMPDELMARISQSLELEQERRAAAGPVGVPTASTEAAATESTSGQEAATTTSGAVVSLDSERQRRRPGRTVLWLGGAAAVAMVATVSVNQFIGADNASDSGVAANVPVTTESAESGAEAGAADSEEQAEDGSDAAAPDEAPEGEAAPTGSVAEPPPLTEGEGDVASSTRVYAPAGTVELDTTDWAGEVSAWLAADLSRGSSTGTTPDCLSTSDLDTSHANSVVLSDAVWADEPATLVVAEATEGDTAWLLSPDCTSVLSGPTPLD